MRIGGLGILTRTSDRKRFNLLSWHSPHSLTWRFIVSLARQPLWTFKPYLVARKLVSGHGGLAIGLGQFASFRAWRDNNGWQLHGALLWHALDFAQQPPMWFKDIYRHDRDEELERDFASQRHAPVIAQDHPTIQ